MGPDDFVSLYLVGCLGSNSECKPGNYCAANAFMDTFGARRRAKQLPAISLQWGPWAEVGMAARAGTLEGRKP